MELRVSIFQRKLGRSLFWHTLGLGTLDRVEVGPTQSKVQQRLTDGLRKAAEKLWPRDLELLEPARGRKLEVVTLDMNMVTEDGKQRFYGKVPLILEPRDAGPASDGVLMTVYHPLRPHEWFVHEDERDLVKEAELFFRTRWGALDDETLMSMRSDSRDRLRLVAFSVSPHALEDELLEKKKKPEFALMGSAGERKGTELLSNLAINQTVRAMDGRLRLGMPRTPHRERLSALVCGTKKSSVLLVGESGSGKSVLLRQVVADLLEADDFASHRNLDRVHTVWQIKGRRIIAGMSYLGQWEKRCVDLVEACRKHRGILWVDDIEAWGRLGETRESDRSLSTFFRGPIARGELTVVAECTPSGYQRLRDDADGLASAFTTIFVDPTDRAETMRMLVHEARGLELEHQLAFDPLAFRTIYELGGALAAGSAYPGKSIDLLRQLAADQFDAQPDLSQAEAEVAAGRKIAAIKALRTRVRLGLRQAKEAVESYMERGRWPSMQAMARAELPPIRSLDDSDFLGPSPQGTIGPADVVQTLAKQTGMPPILLSSETPLRDADVEDQLTNQIMGQQPAVTAVRDLVVRIKAGLTDPSRPFGVFLFTGPTGTGKTEMAKCLAEYLYGDTARLMRFDMSEYSGADAPARLIGDRYEPQGVLTSAVLSQPFCVVLLDEIEKANPSVLNLLLQLFDDGRLTDASGTVVDFTHTVVIMTSNLGAKKTPSVGFDESATETAREVEAAVKDFFPPELFNRIERVVQFAPLGGEAVRRIARRELQRILQRRGLTERNVFVRFTPAVVDAVVSRGFNQRDGARSLKRFLEDTIGGFLADEIAGQRASAVRLLWLYMDGGELRLHVEQLADAEALGEPSALAGVLELNGQELRGLVPQALEQARELLASPQLVALQETLSARVQAFAADGAAPEDRPLFELDQLQSELEGLVDTLATQLEYDPVLVSALDHDAAIEREAELREVDEFAQERLAVPHGEVFVRTLDHRALSPALPLQNRSAVLDAIGQVHFVAHAVREAEDPSEHCVLIELSRVSRSSDGSRFVNAAPGLLEWLADGYRRDGRGSCDAVVFVDEDGTPHGVSADGLWPERAWSRCVMRVVGVGVRTFFKAEHGTHTRESMASGTEIVRVRVIAGESHPREHLARIEALRQAFVDALESGTSREALPEHPDTVLPTVRRYRFDPRGRRELADIEVEDFPLMHAMETQVRRLGDVLPALWLLRLGVHAVEVS